MIARDAVWPGLRRSRGVLLALSALLSLAATQVRAQGGPPGGGWNGGGGWGGGGSRHGGGGYGGGPMGRPPRAAGMPSPEQVEGPPPPAELRRIANLSDEQATRYGKSYGEHMAATKPVRDSLRAAMRAMRDAFHDDDRTKAREQHQLVAREWKTLSSRDEKFTKTLKQMLSKEQAKQYDTWSDERKREAEEHFGHRPPGGDREHGAP